MYRHSSEKHWEQFVGFLILAKTGTVRYSTLNDMIYDDGSNKKTIAFAVNISKWQILSIFS